MGARGKDDGSLLPSGPTEGFEAERKSAFTIGLLHLCVAATVPFLVTDLTVVDARLVLLWCGGQVALAGGAFASAWSVHKGQIRKYQRIAEMQSLGIAVSFGALPWLGPEVASSPDSKLVLLIAAITVTAISASNSAHITSRRPFFWRLVVIIAVSFSLAFIINGEPALAVVTVLWCVSIAAITSVGHGAVLELLSLRRASEESARRDHLTGVLSRAGFFDELDVAASDPQSRGSGRALALFDLDTFKGINDTYGHSVGDSVLQAAASRLGQNLPAGTVIGRVGGDEFAALISTPSEAAGPIVDTALLALAKHVHVGDRELFVGASAGWTAVDPLFDSTELMAQADAAMYHSKRFKIAECTAFDERLQDTLDRSKDLRQRFRSALQNREIVYYYQPLVRLSDRCPVAVELLARWPQPDNEPVPPEEFTRVAIETGLAVNLDQHALRAAVRLLDDWESDEFLQGLVVKVNISPVHLRDDELVKSVRELVPKRHWKRLGLEFVESQLITTASRNRRQLQALLDMDITLSIDDFGVGYSSLTYLRSLPVSELKIDRSFVSAIDTDPVNQALMRAIVEIASTLGLPTVAEGVETEEEYAVARSLGLSICQGFLTGRPSALQDLSRLLVDLRESSLESTTPT